MSTDASKPYAARTADEYVLERAEHEQHGAMRERVAVVLWLRARARSWRAERHREHSPLHAARAVLADGVESLAAAIDRGEHLKP